MWNDKKAHADTRKPGGGMRRLLKQLGKRNVRKVEERKHERGKGGV